MRLAPLKLVLLTVLDLCLFLMPDPRLLDPVSVFLTDERSDGTSCTQSWMQLRVRLDRQLRNVCLIFRVLRLVAEALALHPPRSLCLPLKLVLLTVLDLCLFMPASSGPCSSVLNGRTFRCSCCRIR